MSTDTRLHGCLKKASTKSTTIEKARPPAWEPPNYSWSWSSGIFTLRWSASGTPAPGLQRRLQRPIRQNSKGNKNSEYLAYPRVLRPATKLICMSQMEMGRLYSGLQDRKYQDKREYARPIED